MKPVESIRKRPRVRLNQCRLWKCDHRPAAVYRTKGNPREFPGRSADGAISMKDAGRREIGHPRGTFQPAAVDENLAETAGAREELRNSRTGTHEAKFRTGAGIPGEPDAMPSQFRTQAGMDDTL